MTRLCFLIRQLNDGGAQRQLVELVRGLDKTRFEVTILPLYSGGYFCEEIQSIPGVRLISLQKRGRWDLFGLGLRLIKEVRRLRPDILHGYLALGNILAVLLKPVVPGMRTAWGLRGGNKPAGTYDRLSMLLSRIERRLRRFPDVIIVNSQSGRDHHARLGYPAEKMVVIPNGIDTDRFQPDPAARQRLRAEWQIPDGVPLVGLVGRIDPVKDHATFLGAAAMLTKENPQVRFAFVGSGPPEFTDKLHALERQLCLEERVQWVGLRNDMPAVHNALDTLVLCSLSEGFPNVVGEAMACGTPCVVTDVGDCAYLVGALGEVVPPGTPQALANGIRKALAQPRAALAQQSRQRILENFSIQRLVARTEEALWPKD